MSGELTQLPNGDLWRAPVRDEQGNIVERPDSVDLSALPPMKANMSPDVAAMLMADLQRKADAAKGKGA
jgi:hypothetical protein